MFYKSDKINDDFSRDNDYFNGQEYADEIVEALKNDDIKSIGLYGKWGIGKTSITENAIKMVKHEGLYEEKNIIKYNAWKYNKYDFMRDFLIECSKQIEGEDAAKLKEYSYYNDRTEETHVINMLWKAFFNFLHDSWVFFFCVLLGFACLTALTLYINYLYPSLFECEDVLIPLVTAFIGFLLPIFVVSNVSNKNISKKFSPEQFSRDFDLITNGKKILIFIDDIDRCSSEEIKDTFDILKTFILSKSNDIKFIIPIDPNVLYSTLGDKTYDYFSKIIDYPIIIKKYESFSFEGLKKSIMKEINTKYTSIISDGIYLASKYYIDTPRKFKKFINQFVNEVYKYEPRTIRQKGAMFSKLIILKNEFPLYYDSLINNYVLTKRVSDEMIIQYDSDKLIDTDTVQKGVKFDKKLLEFLSKTSNIDLYDFSLFESNMTYDRYKIKSICEEPIMRNAFDEDNKIDLSKNVEFLEYELMNNVISPINNNQFFYRDLLNKISFLFNQFDKQINFSKARNLLTKINQDRIKEDRTLLSESGGSSKINWLYIDECLNVYNYNKLKKSDDFLYKCIIDFIYDNKDCITDDLDKLYEFVNIFNDEKIIANEHLCALIDYLLEKDFNKFSELLNWYFDKNYSIDKVNRITPIINHIYNYGENECLNNYLINKYNKNNSFELLDGVINHSSLVLQKLGLFEKIINHLSKIVNLKNIDFEYISNFLYTLRFDSRESAINNLIFSIVKRLKTTTGFDNDKYISIIRNFGKNYDGLTVNIDMIQAIVNQSTSDVRNSILDYNFDLDIFQNYSIIKDGVILDSRKKTIKSMLKTYMHFESRVYADLLKKNKIDVSILNSNEIAEIVNLDVNKMIYIISESEFNFGDINVFDVNFDTLEYNRIQNSKLRSIFINNLFKDLLYTSNIVIGNEDTTIITSALKKYLNIFNHLIVDFDYVDDDIIKNFRVLEKHLINFDLYDSILIPEIRIYDQLIYKLLSNSKYKSRNSNYKRLEEMINN